MDTKDKLVLLDELFGNYRAEWLHEDIFKFFATPSYLNELTDRRPCVLIGGRGTGKTTVLKGLSYQGQYALNNQSLEEFDKVPYIGIYYRTNTNHVTVFSGKNISIEKWIPIFSHYINLIFTYEVLYFINWHKSLSPEDEQFSPNSCRHIASTLLLSETISSSDKLFNEIERALYTFQSSINNIADGNMPNLSMSGVPIKLVTEESLKLKQFRNKSFYFLIDEYENLLDYQQIIVNSLLKHVPESYTFKIGVRENGWRVKTTLNEDEVLNDPADYVLFDIVRDFTDKENGTLFDKFAQDVCVLRLKNLYDDGMPFACMDEALTSISIEEEGLKWGVEEHDYCKKVVEFEKEKGIDLNIHPLYKFFLCFWAVCHNEDLEAIVKDFELNRKNWNVRYDNYRYSLLFKIKRGRGSGEISKYYAGWNTFVKLSNGNIRYLMELVYKAYFFYLCSGGDISKPIPLNVQTKAAKHVGWKNLTELDGTTKKGVQLTRMVQSLGTVFGQLAKDGDNLAPEIVQFEIEGKVSERTAELLSAGVMYLALVRMPANKLSSKSDVRDYMYSLHPIFAPYFGYSFRKKRKMSISDEEFLKCIDNQAEGVSAILRRKNIVLAERTAEPKQLDFFDIFDDND